MLKVIIWLTISYVGVRRKCRNLANNVWWVNLWERKPNLLFKIWNLIGEERPEILGRQKFYVLRCEWEGSILKSCWNSRSLESIFKWKINSRLMRVSLFVWERSILECWLGNRLLEGILKLKLYSRLLWVGLFISWFGFEWRSHSETLITGLTLCRTKLRNIKNFGCFEPQC